MYVVVEFFKHKHIYVMADIDFRQFYMEAHVADALMMLTDMQML